MNKEKSEKKSAERSRAPRSPKSVRLIVERHYIGNVPMQNFMRTYQRDFSRRNVFKCLQIATTKNRLN